MWAMLWLLLTIVQAAPFVSLWITTAANEVITLPMDASTSVEVSWGDGLVETNVREHKFAHPGWYNISITGPIQNWSFNNAGHRRKIYDIFAWGDFVIGPSSRNMFMGCNNLRVLSASDQPIMLHDASLFGMFDSCEQFDTELKWNTWNVTDMTFLFSKCASYNRPINFVTDNLVRASGMLMYCVVFNSPVNLTNTSNVIDMSNLFWHCHSFDQPVNLDTRSVTNFYSMFSACYVFNQPLDFDTSSATIMRYVFVQAFTFDQPLNWNTSKVYDMAYMFWDATVFNQPLNFNTGQVVTIDHMFLGATSFSQDLHFDTSQVSSMEQMFAGASNFSGRINFTSTAKVTNMREMFTGTSFNHSLNFDTSAVTAMDRMFDLSPFEQNLAGWSTSATTSCSEFCKSCGLPAFPLCEPCKPRLVSSLGWSVCNCTQDTEKEEEDEEKGLRSGLATVICGSQAPTHATSQMATEVTIAGFVSGGLCVFLMCYVGIMRQRRKCLQQRRISAFDRESDSKDVDDIRNKNSDSNNKINSKSPLFKNKNNNNNNNTSLLASCLHSPTANTSSSSSSSRPISPPLTSSSTTSSCDSFASSNLDSKPFVLDSQDTFNPFIVAPNHLKAYSTFVSNSPVKPPVSVSTWHSAQAAFGPPARVMVDTPPVDYSYSAYPSPNHQLKRRLGVGEITEFHCGAVIYKVVRVLGKGTFGVALHCTDNKGDDYVVKVQFCFQQNHNDAPIREAALLAKLPRSPHVLHLLDFFYETDNLFCIVLSYCSGGTLASQVSLCLCPSEVLRILRELSEGLSILHAADIVHRDVKPDNIFLQDSTTRTVVLGDMGLARLAVGGFYESTFGHKLFKAPEIELRGKFSSRSDMWAVGCVGLELLSGKSMESRFKTQHLSLGQMTQEEIDEEIECCIGFAQAHTIYSLIRSLLRVNAHERLTAKQVCSTTE